MCYIHHMSLIAFNAIHLVVIDRELKLQRQFDGLKMKEQHLSDLQLEMEEKDEKYAPGLSLNARRWWRINTASKNANRN
jgi:hypothetical protein